MGMFDFITDDDQRALAEKSYNDTLEQKLQESLQEKIEEATAGLKNNNVALLTEKKAILDKLKMFGDVDPEKALEALKFIEENEDAQLIKNGRIEELMQKRTSTLRADHEAKLLELKSMLDEVEKEKINYKTQFETKTVSDAIREAALKAKVRPEALTDVLMRGAAIFSLGADKTIEARTSDGKLRKTDKDLVLTPDNWIDELKSSAPHYWPSSAGAGAFGATNFEDQGDAMKALERAAASGDHATYRKLREKMLAKKS